MKKLFSILSIAALSFAAITSCTKEEQAPVEEEGINITIIGGDKDLNNDPSKTKTYVSEEGKTVHVYWQETDKLRVYEVLDNGEQVYYAATKKTTVLDGGKTAEFEANLSGSVTGEHSSYVYTAIYPEGCVSKSGEKYRVLIPETQTLNNGTNLASDADVLIGAPIDKGNTRISSGDVLEYHFTRYGTTVKMTLKGITAGEKLKKVEIKAPVSISGYSYVNLLTGEITDRSTNTTMTLVVNDVEVNADGSIPVWYRVLSGLWHATSSKPISIKVYTDKASYSKEISSTAEDLVFAEGGLTTFGVSLGNRTENPTIEDGDYIIAAKTSDSKYYAMSCEATGDRLKYTDITEGFSTTEYTGNNYDLVWNFKTSTEGLAITSVNGDYLISSAKGASVGSDATYYSITEKTESNQKYYNIYDKSSYYLELNVSSKWYAFYNTDASASMIRDLYVIPANVDKTPVIILDKEATSVAGNTESYDITFKKRFLTGDVTAIVDSDPDGAVDGSPVVGTGKVTVNLNANTTAADKVATIKICSASDNIDKTFTLTLKKYQATTKDEISATTAGHTNSSYTDWSGKSKSTANSGIVSDAVYAGKTAFNSSKGNSLQMNSNSGNAIWTTTSGGLVTSVSVDFDDANNKSIKVYGKNTAFNGDGTDGAEEIGTLSSSNTKVTATSDYEYIMLKASGATYINKFVVEWKAKAAATGITVKTVPSKTEYHVGEAFDPAGLVINVKYDDGSEENVAYTSENASQFTFTPALDVEGGLQAGNTSVKISYKSQSVDLTINVYTWSYNSLVIATPPTKTTYWAGETFDKAGMVVNAHYVDNKPETHNTKDEVVTDYTFPSTPLVAGTTSITLSKTIGDVTKKVDQTITVNARPEFTVTPSNNSANPIAVGEGEYDEEPISVAAGEDVVWTVSKVSGADDIMFTEDGTSSGKINVMIAANTGLARDFVLRVTSSTAGVYPASYDVYLHQDACTSITSVALATPTGLSYDNSTKKLTWNAVTTDVNGKALVDYTPMYNLSIDGNSVETNLTNAEFDITTMSSTLATGDHTANLVAVGNEATYTNSAATNLSFTVPELKHDYKLVESSLTDWRGDYLIAYSEDVFMDGSLAGGTSGVGKAQSHVAPGDNLSNDKKTVSESWGDAHYVTIEAIDDSYLSKGYVIKSHSSTTPYFYQASNSNGMSCTATKSTAANYPISIEFTSASDIKLKLGGEAAGAVLRYNSTTGSTGEMFRYYKDGKQSAIYLYKKQ